MSIRRSLAAVLSVGTLFLATACAGDDLDSGSSKGDDTSTPSASSRAMAARPARRIATAAPSNAVSRPPASARGSAPR